MKKRIKKFCLRGLLFGGIGPLIYGIVMLILYFCNLDTLSNGLMIFKGILSTYLIGFICAGTSIVWEEEKLGIGFAILIHGSILYLSYLMMYLVNNWIPKNPISVLIFSVVFILTYLIIWLIIYLTEKNRAKKLNNHLK